MRIHVESTAAIIVDVQEKLLAVMDGPDRLVQRLETLIRGLQSLKVPILASEQYPKGLGPTVPAVRGALANTQSIVKAAFSCCDDEPFMSELSRTGRRSIIVAGIEAHVCVLQTALDLHSRGFQPIVVADAVSSRNPFDREIALRRMEQSGVTLTTTESVLFELTRMSGTPTFKAISKLIK